MVRQISLSTFTGANVSPLSIDEIVAIPLVQGINSTTAVASNVEGKVTITTT